jgi:hypothetical protein
VKTVTPQQMLEMTTEMVERLGEMKKKAVFVGLPKDKVGGAIYGDGMTVIQIGAIHEYGAPEQGIPERSFLRVPFATKRDEVNKAVAAQYEAVINGKRDVIAGLGLIGVIATNISKGSFVSAGYGKWKALEPATIRAKTVRGKAGTTPLIDTGTLRNSINWVVRNAS